MERIKDVAIAYWRLEKWVKAANIDKKVAAESSLRSIKRFLDENSIEIDDLTGDTYDSGLAVEIVYREDDDGSPYDGIAKITEMVKPIILQKGSVIQFGQAIIGNKLNINDNANDILIPEENPDIEEIQKEPIDTVEAVETIQTVKSNPNIISKRPVFNYLMVLGVVVLIIISTINLFSNFKLDNKTLETSVDNKVLEELRVESKYNINIINEKLEGIEKKLEPKEDEVTFIKYTIKIGDSLEKICRENNIDYANNIRVIKKINSISNENKLYLGQIILLPKIN